MDRRLRKRLWKSWNFPTIAKIQKYCNYYLYHLINTYTSEYHVRTSNKCESLYLCSLYVYAFACLNVNLRWWAVVELINS